MFIWWSKLISFIKGKKDISISNQEEEEDASNDINSPLLDSEIQQKILHFRSTIGSKTNSKKDEGEDKIDLNLKKIDLNDIKLELLGSTPSLEQDLALFWGEEFVQSLSRKQVNFCHFLLKQKRNNLQVNFSYENKKEHVLIQAVVTRQRTVLYLNINIDLTQYEFNFLSGSSRVNLYDVIVPLAGYINTIERLKEVVNLMYIEQ